MAQAAGKNVTTSYPGRITLFRASERIPTGHDRWDLGWGQIAAHRVDVCEIAGAHHALLLENVTEVGRRLKQCLAMTQQSRLGGTTAVS